MNDPDKALVKALIASIRAEGYEIVPIARLRDREALALAELKRLYEKTGWQSTADVIARLEQ